MLESRTGRTLLAVLLLGSLAVLSSCEEPRDPTALDDVEASFARGGVPGPPSTAVVNFGAMDVGSGFPPAEHDASFHAVDKIRPRTTVIAEGGTVTFNVGPVHQLAIYAAGTEPEDISVAPANLEPNPLFPGPPVINDPNGRLHLGDPVSFSGYTDQFTFLEPGRYLVICTFLPHFTVAKMYAYIEVKAAK